MAEQKKTSSDGPVDTQAIIPEKQPKKPNPAPKKNAKTPKEKGVDVVSGIAGDKGEKEGTDVVGGLTG